MVSQCGAIRTRYTLPQVAGIAPRQPLTPSTTHSQYTVLPASSPFNTQGVDLVVARPEICAKLSRSSGTLRCSSSTLSFVDPITDLQMSFVGVAGVADYKGALGPNVPGIPIGAATA